MRPFHLFTAAASGLLALAAPAAAQSLASDVKCLVVSNLFAKSKDPKARQAGVETRFFYLGRLNGSAAQIQAALEAQGRTITQANAGPTMQACARAVVQRASEVQAIGQRIRPPAKK
jgi:hypothetical protein